MLYIPNLAHHHFRCCRIFNLTLSIIVRKLSLLPPSSVFFFFLTEFLSLPATSPQKANNRKTYLLLICTLTCLKQVWVVSKMKFYLQDEVFIFFLNLLSKNEYYVTQCGFLCLNWVQPLGKCLYAAKINSFQVILLAPCVIYKILQRVRV